MISTAFLAAVAEAADVCIVPDAQGFVGASSGTVLVSTPQGMFAATPGASVLSDTPLITGSDGQAEVVFNNLCIAQVPPNSLLTISAAPEGFLVTVTSRDPAQGAVSSQQPASVAEVDSVGLALVAANVVALGALAFGLNQTQSVSLQ